MDMVEDLALGGALALAVFSGAGLAVAAVAGVSMFAALIAGELISRPAG